jgi:hypothetical protein
MFVKKNWRKQANCPGARISAALLRISGKGLRICGHLEPGLRRITEDVHRRRNEAGIVKRSRKDHNPGRTGLFDDDWRSTVWTKVPIDWLSAGPAWLRVNSHVAGYRDGSSRNANQCGKRSSDVPLTILAVAGEHGHGLGLTRIVNLATQTFSGYV